VEKIRAGNSNIRNPILVSYVAKGLLPYHGLGSGIKRALEKWPDIDFADDHDGCLFTVTVYRKPVGELDLVDITPEGSLRTDTMSGEHRENVGEASVKTSEKIISLIKDDALITIERLAEHCGVTTRSIERNLKKLQQRNKIKRVGPDKGGHWEVIE
jgi:ATP-dependent DNA helicase RecG